MAARWAELAGRLLPAGRARRDDRDRLERARAAPGRSVLQGIVRPGRPPAPAARDARASRVFPRGGHRRPAFHSPREALFEAQSVDARIRISAENDTHSMGRVDPRRQAIFDRARDPIRQAASKGRWVLTQYPTALTLRTPACPCPIRGFRHPRHVPRPADPRRPGKSLAAGRRALSNSCRASDRSGSRPTAPI